MGKASRNKALRKESVSGFSSRAPIEMLYEAVKAIGDAFGSAPDCAAAAALLKLTADRLGYDLTPRAVALVATQPSTGDVAFMGPRASTQFPEDQRHLIEDHRPDSKDTGHMVLTSEDPMMLFDPNLRQLGGFGIPAPSVAIRIKSVAPEEGVWTAHLQDLDLVYLLDESNTALRGAYERALVGHVPDADNLAKMLRKGITSDQIRRQQARR